MKDRKTKDKGGMIVIWVLIVLVFAVGLLNANTQLFGQQLKTLPEGFEERKPPKELKLTSILYELAIASDKEKFAKEHEIILHEGKVKVFIFLDPASLNSEREKLVKSYNNIVVEKKSNNLLRALIPID